MEWFENALPMRGAHKLSNGEYLAMDDAYIIQIKGEGAGKDWLDAHAMTEILGAK
jgi:hypothetical protein